MERAGGVRRQRRRAGRRHDRRGTRGERERRLADGRLDHEKQVWTNITSDSFPAGGDCGDWKQADNTTARVGFSGYKDEESEAHKKWLALRRWTDTGFSRKCYDTDVHTYCIQVK